MRWLVVLKASVPGVPIAVRLSVPTLVVHQVRCYLVFLKCFVATGSSFLLGSSGCRSALGGACDLGRGRAES